jgi:hypothetical protein
MAPNDTTLVPLLIGVLPAAACALLGFSSAIDLAAAACAVFALAQLLRKPEAVYTLAHTHRRAIEQLVRARVRSRPVSSSVISSLGIDMDATGDEAGGQHPRGPPVSALAAETHARLVQIERQALLAMFVAPVAGAACLAALAGVEPERHTGDSTGLMRLFSAPLFSVASLTRAVMVLAAHWQEAVCDA